MYTILCRNVVFDELKAPKDMVRLFLYGDAYGVCEFFLSFISVIGGSMPKGLDCRLVLACLVVVLACFLKFEPI